MIVVHHTHAYFGYGGSLAAALPLDQGVSFFFVLSGFILFYTNRGIATPADAGRFIVARVGRIWPLHAATFALTLIFLPQPWGPAGPNLGPAAELVRPRLAAAGNRNRARRAGAALRRHDRAEGRVRGGRGPGQPRPGAGPMADLVGHRTVLRGAHHRVRERAGDAGNGPG